LTNLIIYDRVTPAPIKKNREETFVKKVLLWLYGEHHDSSWLYLGIVGLVIAFCGIYLVCAVFSLKISVALFWAIMALGLILLPVLIYQIGGIYIARAKTFESYYLVEFNQCGRAVGYGEYFWRTRGFTYKKVPIWIDGQQEFALSGSVGDKKIRVVFSLSLEEEMPKDALKYYAAAANAWNGEAFFSRLKKIFVQRLGEKKDEIIAIVAGAESSRRKDEKIIRALGFTNPFSTFTNVVLEIRKKVDRWVLPSA